MKSIPRGFPFTEQGDGQAKYYLLDCWWIDARWTCSPIKRSTKPRRASQPLTLAIGTVRLAVVGLGAAVRQQASRPFHQSGPMPTSWPSRPEILLVRDVDSNWGCKLREHVDPVNRCSYRRAPGELVRARDAIEGLRHGPHLPSFQSFAKSTFQISAHQQTRRNTFLGPPEAKPPSHNNPDRHRYNGPLSYRLLRP